MSDLIKREDAIKVISNRICDNKWVCEYRINSLPSADAEQGEWIYGTDPITREKDCMAWTCSLCGGKYPWQPNYCPNCGARMKGGDDE